jgi:hypothetical protein
LVDGNWRGLYTLRTSEGRAKLSVYLHWSCDGCWETWLLTRRTRTHTDVWVVMLVWNTFRLGPQRQRYEKLTPDGVGDDPKCGRRKRLAMSCRSSRLGTLVQCIAGNEWLDHCSSPSSVCSQHQSRLEIHATETLVLRGKGIVYVVSSAQTAHLAMRCSRYVLPASRTR